MSGNMDSEENWLFAIDLPDDDENAHSSKDEKVPCQFAPFGCQFKGLKKKGGMKQHRKEKSNFHLTLLRQHVEHQEKRIREQREKIAQHENYVARVEEVFHEYKEQLEEQKRQAGSHKTMAKDLQHDLAKLRVTSRKQNKNLSESVEELSDKFDQFRMQYSIFKSRVELRDGRRYGEHLWIIKDYSRRIRRIRSGKLDDPIRSDPFYTGSPGYRFCAWAYLNGRGKVLGESVSVYGKVMAGDFDAIVQWPIRPQFTFTLYEQNRAGTIQRRDIVRRRKVQEIRRERDEKGRVHGGIPRPLGDDRSIIVGFDDFVTHEELHTCGFLKNDNIFIKIEVEITF